MVCGFISRGVNYRQNLQNHMLTHTGEKPHQCPECPMRFLKKSNLKRHMAVHQPKPPPPPPPDPLRLLFNVAAEEPGIMHMLPPM